MLPSPVADACRLLDAAVDALAAAAGPGASAAELVETLRVRESVVRRLELLGVQVVAELDRRGTFAEHGYASPTRALQDLLRLDRGVAAQRVAVAEAVGARAGLAGAGLPGAGLPGAGLPAKLPATAEVFAAGDTSQAHVAVIARLLASPPAGRLAPEIWAGAEIQLADAAAVYTPRELQQWGTALLEMLDEDGPEPDDGPPPQVNELRLTRFVSKPGGRLVGRYDDAAMFEAITAVLDAKAAPLTGEDERSGAERQAEALAEVCGWVLDHGELPAVGGRRPTPTVQIRLEDLEQRARSGMLEFAGHLAPTALRQLACDSGVVPMVLDGAGQPLDVGRLTRSIPDGLRRAVTARDGGCAHPGCDRPPSWCEIHHVIPWEHGGPTALGNLVMLCRAHHRQIHATDWVVRLRDGIPEFVPPAWVDPDRTPRTRPRTWGSTPAREGPRIAEFA
ncbi:HNH endonuclease [Pseudonocardia kujensis]|uniref:HNH endonuclease signature motif containing protein n=1 Tax=Pseudonocardia kujensis TaxID=1128675 RepID=UPI001E3A09D9|nr:HNH endonuclease signature motif containing protein [Pseudonocardia kujensis]MCE0768511.1 HNH endonuclease [Pseudonocardia kujensis]